MVILGAILKVRDVGADGVRAASCGRDGSASDVYKHFPLPSADSENALKETRVIE